MLKFTQMNEAKKTNHKYEYGCLMLDLKIKNWQDILSQIDTDDIYNPDGTYGLEENPHITILYGLHDDVKLEDMFNFVVSEIKSPTFEVTEVSYFEPDEYDVLKFTVKSDDLTTINKKLTDTFPYTTDFPEYKPHLTIAYLKKGTAKKYKGLNLVLDIDTEDEKVCYSFPPEYKVWIKI